MIAISIPIPLVTIGWIVVSVLIGLLALAQGRSFVSWSLASAIATPFVGLLLLILPKPKKSGQLPSLPKPSRRDLAVAPSKAALPFKAIKALHMGSSRFIGVISRRKAAAYPSQKTITAATEIDKEIAAAVRGEFPRKRTDR